MNKFKIILSLLGFLKERKKYWLIPIVVILLLLAVLLIFAQNSVIAPLIYPLF